MVLFRHTPLCPHTFSRPEYLPLHWSAYTQPEGSRYFLRDGAIPVVTEANIRLAEVHAKIEYWIREIETRVSEGKISLAENAELYLDLEEQSDSCLYYFVDHTNCVLFWLELLTSDTLSLMPSVSASHFRTYLPYVKYRQHSVSETGLALQEQYWSHVEFFPSHRIAKQSLQLSQLINIFLYAKNGVYPFVLSGYRYVFF